MFFFYCLGITTGGNIQLLFQSLLGKKGYLNYVETHWIDRLGIHDGRAVFPDWFLPGSGAAKFRHSGQTG
jgi:hypothetical protein